MRRRHWGSVVSRPPRRGYYVRLTWEGQRIFRAAGPTKEIANQRLSAAESLLKRGVSLAHVLAEVFGDTGGRQLTFRKAAPMFLEFYRARTKPSTYKAAVHRMALLGRSPWAGKTLAKISAADLVRWMDARRKQGASGATVNRDMLMASVLFKWALRLGYTEENPVRRVQRFSEKGRARKTWLTAEECNALLDACDEVLRPVIVCALHAGLRRGELMSLQWRSVDFAGRSVVIEPEAAKSGKLRSIPMTSTLYDSLRAVHASRKVKRIDQTDHVFLTRTGRPLLEGNLRRLLASALGRCDLPQHRRDCITLHVLRHSFASHLAQRGVPFQVIAELLGHATTYVTERYAHMAPDTGREAVAMLQSALGS